jgi:hypothetical protein
MKRKLIIIGLMILSIAALLTTVVHSDQEPIETVKPVEVVKEEILTPTQYADKYAEQYGINASVFKKVMFCESGNNPKAVGDGGRAVSVMQFHRPTFDSFSKRYGKELDYYSYKDQIELAAWMFSKGHQGHWTCYKIVTGK